MSFNRVRSLVRSFVGPSSTKRTYQGAVGKSPDTGRVLCDLEISSFLKEIITLDQFMFVVSKSYLVSPDNCSRGISRRDKTG